MGRKPKEVVDKSLYLKVVEELSAKVEKLEEELSYSRYQATEADLSNFRTRLTQEYAQRQSVGLSHALSIVGQAHLEQQEEIIRARGQLHENYQSTYYNATKMEKCNTIHPEVPAGKVLAERKSVSVTRKTKPIKTKRKYKRRKK